MPTHFTKSMIGLVLCGGVAGCASQIAVSSEYDPRADFSGLSSWNWAPAKAGAARKAHEDPILEGRIREAIEAEFEARGFERQAEGTPTFLVGYTAATEEAMQSWAIDNYYGYSRPTYRFYAGRSRDYPLGTGTQRQIVYEYQQGTLVLDVSAPDTHRLLWRAYARATIDQDQSQETRDKQLREAIRKMLKDFPPK